MIKKIKVISFNHVIEHEVEVPFMMEDKSIIALLESMYGFETKKIEAGIYDSLRGYDYVLTDRSIAVAANESKLDIMKKQLDEYRKALQDIVKIKGNAYNSQDAVLIANTAKSIAWTTLKKHGDN